MGVRRTTGTVAVQYPLVEIVSMGSVAVSSASSKTIRDRRVWPGDIAFGTWQSVTSTATVKSLLCGKGTLTITLSTTESGTLNYIVFRDVSQGPGKRGAGMRQGAFSKGVFSTITR